MVKQTKKHRHHNGVVNHTRTVAVYNCKCVQMSFLRNLVYTLRLDKPYTLPFKSTVYCVFRFIWFMIYKSGDVAKLWNSRRDMLK